MSSLRQLAARPIRWFLGRSRRKLISKWTVPDFKFALELQSMRTKGPFFFVQVGAQDGVTGDPIHVLVRRERWQGVLVEPRRTSFAALQRSYSGCPGLQFLNVAIAPEAGEQEMHFVRDEGGELPDWAQGLGSFRLETLLSHESEIPGLRERLARERVTCTTWEAVLDRVPRADIDLLQIDVEGLDYELLRCFPFARSRPGVVRYEHKHLRPEDRVACDELLLARGYILLVEPRDTTAFAKRWPQE